MGDRSEGNCIMMSFGWSLVEATAQVLEGNQREAVLGDMVEAGESAWPALLGILGLFLRREATFWKSWRPWLSAFGVSLPASLLLMGVSLSVSQTWQRLSNPNLLEQSAVAPAFLLGIFQVLLLTGWSWSGGFVVGRLSRRTMWLSALMCCSPCVFCLARFHLPSLSRFCLLLFLLPAIFGARQGSRRTRINLKSTITFTLALTLLMIATWNNRGHAWWSPQSWVLETTLIWPAWFMAAVASRETRAGRRVDQEKVAA
jgi:hypothetical protein